jgi:hypothetical protein
LSINTDPQNKKSSDLYIPEHIRYDPNLSFFQKFLLAEIIALSKQTGQCWATNKHFAEAYDVSERYVRKSIQNLIKEGYITSKLNNEKGGERFLIYITKVEEGRNNSSGEGGTIVPGGREQLFRGGGNNSSLPPTSESTDTSMRNGRNQTPNKKYNNKINNIINKQNNFFQKNVNNFERQKLETEALGKTKTYMQIMDEHFARVKAQREKRGSG